VVTKKPSGRLGKFAKVLRYTIPALKLVWRTSPYLALGCLVATLILGSLPGAIAYVSKLLVDAVVESVRLGTQEARTEAFRLVGAEAALVLLAAFAGKLFAVWQSLLRELMGERVQELILNKALTLGLPDYEDSRTYDRLVQARKGATSRPMSLASRFFSLVQNLISLALYAFLLAQFSPLAVLILLLGGLPAFLVEAIFSRKSFQLFKRQSARSRRREYFLTVMAREDYAKEVKLFQLGPTFLSRFRDIFESLYREKKSLTIRHNLWAFLGTVCTTGALYGAFFWVISAATAGEITLGDMTMYLLIFKQGQSAISKSLKDLGGLYDDNLYLANLYGFLNLKVRELPSGSRTSGETPGEGLKFEEVSFVYPGTRKEAVKKVSFQVRTGESVALVGANGSGKTTLVKLLTRLYEPSEGRISFQGSDLREWDTEALREKIGVIFQDFIRYHLTAGENIGVGDKNHLDDEERWREAADKASATSLVEALPKSFHSQLGLWFFEGRDLSGGQWQKLAIARAFMRKDSEILVLDEPTAALDPEAEQEIFKHFQDSLDNQIGILISHRFSTVRMADKIVVLDEGEVVELGSHEELLANGGRYCELFEEQASSYR